MRNSELGWWRTVWETGSITECDWSAMCAPPKLCPSWCTAHSVSKTRHLLPTAPESNYLAVISRLLGKCYHLYLIFIFLACCLRNIYSDVLDASVLFAPAVFFLKARLSASVCPFTLLGVLLCVKGVREKSLSQCMTLSNRLGIKLTTTKTFPAPKPIYTPIQASLMSALKSTTNSPRRKSLAHRGCSGCLSPRARACACARGLCVRMRACVFMHASVYICARSPSVFSSTMTNHFFFLLTFIFLDFTPLVPLYVHLLQHLSCSLCFGVRCFNKLSHILNSSRTFLHLIFFFFLKALPSQSKSKPVLSFSRLLSRYTVPCVFSVNKPLICSPTLYFSDCLIYDGLGMCLAAGHFNYRSRSLSLE